MFAIVANPESGNGKSAELVKEIASVLAQRGEQSRVYETEFEGDGKRQTQRALAAGCSDVVCVGGDGTLSEVIGPLVRREATLYLVPGGTGNDFARSLGLPKDPLKAFCAQLDGEDVRIDCASVNGKPFVNVAGSGFDVAVLRKMEELKQIYPGAQAYRKAVLATLGSYEPFCAEVMIEDEPPQRVRATIVEIANGQYIGGGMRVAPDASIDDGLLDVMIVDRVPRRAIPLLLPLFIKGWHKHLPVARMVRAKRVVLRAPGMVANIDGRLEEMDCAEFEILPGALRMKRAK